MKSLLTSLISGPRLPQILLAAIFFSTAALPAQPVVDRARPHVMAEGLTISLHGSGLTTTQRVSFIEPRMGRIVDVAFEVIDDTEITVTFPEDRISDGQQLLIETTEGTLFHLPDLPASPVYKDGPIGYMEPDGEITGDVRRGLYVKPGAVLYLADLGAIPNLILVADGAFVSFEDAGDLPLYFNLYYSDEGQILGDVPDLRVGLQTVREVATITLVDGFPTFDRGSLFEPTIVGNGSITVEHIPNSPFTFTYPTELTLPYLIEWETYTFTATPAPGAYFSGWSGDEVSQDNSITVDVGNDGLALTATFSAGRTLDVHEPDGVTVSISPDKATYANGEEVTVSATVDPGYVFVGWAGDAFSQANTITVTMDADKVLIPATKLTSTGPAPIVTSVEPFILPVGETFIVTGENLSTTTRVALISTSSEGFHEVAFTVVNDTQLQVTFSIPSINRPGYLFIENPHGSIYCLPSDGFFGRHGELLPDGSYTGGYISVADVIREGAYADANALKEMQHIALAEPGSVIDFRNIGATYSGPVIYYSEGTIVLGDIPTEFDFRVREDVPQAFQIKPFRLNAGVPPLMEGVPFTYDIVGGGTVALESNHIFTQPATVENSYLQIGGRYAVTALPNAGHFFTGWTGSLTSTESSDELRVDDDPVHLTATFSAGRVLTVFDMPGTSVTISPDLDVYPDGTEVTLTGSAEAGRAFVGWGGDVSGSGSSLTVIMDRDISIVPIIETIGAEPGPTVTATSPNVVMPGDTITVTGSHLLSTRHVAFISPAWHEPDDAAFTVIDDNTLEVFYPEVSRGSDGHFLMVETDHGVTFCAPLLVARDGVFVTAIEDRPYGFDRGAAYIAPGVSFAFDMPPGAGDIVLAAESSVLDFSGFGSSTSMLIYYTPNTVLIGDIPTDFRGNPVAHEVDAVTISTGISPFLSGTELVALVEGPGSVILDPQKDLYAFGESVTATAVPNDGAFFVRWTGTASGRKETVTFDVDRRENTLTGRFSDSPDYFHTWRPEHFTLNELGDLSVSAFDADPDQDSLTNAVEYAFGSNPRMAETEQALTIDPPTNDGDGSGYFIRFKRPVNALDITYFVMISRNLSDWHHNDDESGKVYSIERSRTPLDDTYEEVTCEIFPDEIEGGGGVFVRLNADITEAL